MTPVCAETGLHPDDAPRPDYEGWLIEQAQHLAAAGDHSAITPDMVDALISELRTLSLITYHQDMQLGLDHPDDCPF
ncbi:hypothetical protein [uncultured Thiohalocapsa sp.]|uniref:hypothetical protein n=1 Tax=uncultured Thiohalocapsa sp. TaxID=768990 RepID=UPI0025D392E2|nr:hypothetical protein [uncultured Thiohalocapsa sp.]